MDKVPRHMRQRAAAELRRHAALERRACRNFSRRGSAMMMRLLACVLVGSSLLGCGSTNQSSIPAVANDALAAVIADTCDARSVFLGEEGSHGGGRTLQVKTEIVRGLIESCGFTHIAFEGQIYDFIDLQE